MFIIGKEPLKHSVDIKKLFNYLKSYQLIKEINFYFGEDEHYKLKEFLKKVSKIGFWVITKKVKYIVVGKVGSTIVKERKCDFDIEICMDFTDF